MFKREKFSRIAILSAVWAILASSVQAEESHLGKGAEFQLYSTEIVPLIMPERDQPGFLYDLVRELSERVDRASPDFTIAPGMELRPWKRAFFAVRNGRGKLMLPMTRLPEREDQFIWIAEMMDLRYAFFTTDVPVNSLAEARGLKSVAVYRDTSHEVFLKQQGLENLSRAQGLSNARMLSIGRVAAWYSSVPEAQWLWKIHKLTPDLIKGRDIHAATMWLVGSKDFPEHLIPAFRKAMDGIRQDGTLPRIEQAYF